jgi:hypothetical protein
MLIGSIRNSALLYLTFIKIILARCVGTESLLIAYPKRHSKQTYRQLQTFFDCC